METSVKSPESIQLKSLVEPLPKSVPDALYELPEKPTFLQWIDVLLKSPQSIAASIRQDRFHQNAFVLFMLAMCFHGLYGIIVGSFSGGMQWFAVPAKLALGSALSALMCYPSLYIFSALSGADVKPSHAFFMLTGLLFLTSILLLGFAPVAFVFSCSIRSIGFMGFVHLGIWFISLSFGIRFLNVTLKYLNGKKRSMIYLWGFIFTLTCLQMMVTLSPLLAPSDGFSFLLEKRFFLEHWILEMISGS